MTTINTELLEQHAQMILNAIEDQRINDDNLEDLHHEVFNTDYFIIGYYSANKWIEENFDSTFEAIDLVKEYEMSNFGEFNTNINSESIANMLLYIIGKQVISELDFDCLESLTSALNEYIG